jgi:hypothetical protein
VSQFQVKWVGFDAKSNTWEPIENLLPLTPPTHGLVSPSHRSTVRACMAFHGFSCYESL